ncbi:rhodanese-like domain-containing protein [Thiomicrorhabdus sp. 6S3-12]|uniref:rhodanese-like domain-containing protein n=1 Tax=Thiomicrorhabdus sp. 6S3-12 TaxID=2819681 RepID=UPI001AAD94D2|nr:rhodanese-like domain-containing protein [Thiomicrorhabdus sp. 6S3-12]MBO1924384.1 rhodanese-like domain-containing protein [Thiomicrorhabdus sp. 6S3-12]
MFSKTFPVTVLISLLLLSTSAFATEEVKVKITDKLAEIQVDHNGKSVTIKRNQDQTNTIDEDYALTSRVCPPFCLQPIKLLPGVQTIGELEMLDFLKRKAKGDQSIVIIDSRTPDWVAKGTIPSAINIPWTKLFPQSSSYEPLEVEDILTLRFGAVAVDGLWDFSNAKTLVMYCNGPWCGQSPTNIKALVNLGYPAHKIFWYRGGMQAWHAAGLTTVTP